MSAEERLLTIHDEGQWHTPELGRFAVAIDGLAAVMAELISNDAWTGEAAEAATALLERLAVDYREVADAVTRVDRAVGWANEAYHEAMRGLANLPPTDLPQSFVWDTVYAMMLRRPAVTLPGSTVQVPVKDAIFRASAYLEHEREHAAIVVERRFMDGLDPVAEVLRDPIAVLDDFTKSSTEYRYEPPPDPAHSTASGGGSSTPVIPRGTPSPTPLPPTPAPRPVPALPAPWVPVPDDGDPHLIGIDDDSLGRLPGTDPAVGSPGGGVHGPSGVGGRGLGGMALGGAAAVGAGGVALAGRAGSAGTGMGGTLGASPTRGGLLGAAPGSAGGSGAAGQGGAGAAGSMGARGGMMAPGATGAGGAGGARKDRARGQGGLIAPKLTEDEEFTPQAEGARAGGRSAPREPNS